MSDLRDLYQEVILDHGKKPRNFRALPNAASAQGHNPLCGDRVTVFVKVEGDVAKDVSFEGNGCAISTASASLMTEAVKGRPIADTEALFAKFHDLVTGKGDASGEVDDALGKLVAFAGVSEFPMRVKCATLAWHTLMAALAHQNDTVTTE